MAGGVGASRPRVGRKARRRAWLSQCGNTRQLGGRYRAPAPPAAVSHDSRGLATAEVGLGPTLRILSNIKLLISISTGCE